MILLLGSVLVAAGASLGRTGGPHDPAECRLQPPDDQRAGNETQPQERDPRAGKREPGDRPPRERSGRDRRGPHGGRNGRFGGGSDDDRWPRLTPEVLDEVMEVVRSQVPETLYDRLVKLRAEGPERLRWFRPLVGEYLMLLKRHPALAPLVFEEFGIEHALRGQGRAYKKAIQAGDEPTAAEHQAEIERLVRRQFDIEIQRRRARLEDFQKRLNAQQKRLDLELERLQTDDNKKEESISERIERVKQGKMRGFKKRRGRRGPAPDGARPPGSDTPRRGFGERPDGPRGDRPPGDQRRRGRRPPGG